MKFKLPTRWWPLAPHPAPALPAGLPAAEAGEALPASAWAMLSDRFRNRFMRRPAAAAAQADRSGAGPALPGAPLPALRGLGQWARVAGLLAGAAIVVWVASCAWDLVVASRSLVAYRFTAPALASYPALASVALRPASQLNPDLQQALTPNEDRLLRAVQNLAMFENARSEPLLRAAPAAVQAVVAGSPAALALVAPGDVIKQVNGKEAGFVWDVYQRITERPVRLVELAVQRGAETLTLSLGLKEGERFDMSNHGLLFAVPDSVRYIGKTDAVRIADQLRAAYLDPLPSEWRAPYVEGLLGVSNTLVGNLTTLQAAALGSSSYVRGEDLLAWYQRQFNDSLGVHRLAVERLRMRQAEALLQLGWGVLALAAAGLLALALAIRSTWALR